MASSWEWHTYFSWGHLCTKISKRRTILHTTVCIFFCLAFTNFWTRKLVFKKRKTENRVANLLKMQEEKTFLRSRWIIAINNEWLKCHFLAIRAEGKRCEPRGKSLSSSQLGLNSSLLFYTVKKYVWEMLKEHFNLYMTLKNFKKFGQLSKYDYWSQCA